MIDRFKLHLRPPHLAAEQGFNIEDVPALPPNKTVVDIFSDLLRYLYQCTKEHIRQQLGNDMWESLRSNIDFVLSHPDGWEGKKCAKQLLLRDWWLTSQKSLSGLASSQKARLVFIFA